MSEAAARKLWLSLEALHDVVYFAPGVRDAGMALGLRGFWMTYFAFRAAPMGPVGPEVVIATFAGFKPAMVEKAIPEAWTRVAPEACVEARSRFSADALRDAGVDAEACAAANARLSPVTTTADRTGRPLFTANAAVPIPDDPIAALWQYTSTLREHRGDGHIAALVTAGLTGLQAHLLQVAAGRHAAEEIRSARGWDKQEWARAAAQLQGRGLLTRETTPRLTPAGHALLADIENRTDQLAWTGALAPLGEEGVDEIVELLRPSVRALWDSGVLPDVNPTGLPKPL
ncbi:MAG: hypothetical protein JWL73_3416 [Actinomycetia bacterium]|nr:hypothetical protein [Actinomycetes bacterium]